MKFLKRKSQRDDLGSDADPSPTPTSARSVRDPSPNPVAKDLPPPPPLYARYARITTTPSFDSLNNTLESPSASRFSAFNGSSASGFGNTSPSLNSLSADGANIGSQGRAAGSAFLGPRDTASSPMNPPATAKPEPIKLKQRGRRVATDSSTARVVSMVENRSSNSGPSPPAKPTRAWTNGSADPPASSGVGSVPKTAFEGRLLGQDDGSTNGTRVPSSGMTPRAQNISATSGPSSAQPTDTTNIAANAQTSTITPVSKRSSTVPQPNNRSSVLGFQPTTLQKPILAPEEDVVEVYSFYNAAVRISESPASNTPSPSRTREGPPNALHNRQSPKKLPYVTSNSSPPPISLNDSTSNDSDILVKPPSRRESLPQAVRAPAEGLKFPKSPVAAVRRSPSPTKSRPQPTQTDSPPQQPSGMAGIGALGRNSLSSAAPINPLPSPAPAPVVAKPSRSYSPPQEPSTTTNGRYTASPITLTPVASSEKIAFPKEGSTVIPQYSHSIPEKTPLIRPGANTAPTKTVTPFSVLASANTTPKVSTIPMPSSAASSVSTMRQSRIAAKANASSVAASASSRATETTTSSHVPVPVPVPSPAKPTATQTQPSAPSRQSSSASVASSSGPSATQTRSTATSPSGLNTPADDLPLARAPEPQEVSKKIKLTKNGPVINGISYRSDTDITPPATASRKPQRGSTNTPGPVTSAIQEIQTRDESPEQSRAPSYARRDKASSNGHEENGERFRHNETVAQTPPMEQGQAQLAFPYVNGYDRNYNPYSHTASAAAAAHDMEDSRGRVSPAGNYAQKSRYTPTPELELDYDPDLVYPIEQHLSYPELLANLLYFMQFPDILALSSVSKIIRNMLEDRRELREEVLERFLGTVGYARWDFGKKREPLVLTLRDLNSYLRGVSIPIHRYAEIAEGQNFSGKESGKSRIVRLLASSTRAYSKVVLRLRAQAEMEAILAQASPIAAPANSNRSRPTTPLVRAQSPSPATGTWQKVFHSPLYRIGHAPLLRVFVPSPDGAWLSDSSVLACEKELKRAGIVPLLKIGDVVWDTAVSDEAGFGNVGRLIWDGNYLIDLDYTFSTTGDIPPYLHSLSFPPAYFHKVLRSSGNPVMQLDLRPWGREIASNLQLVQDRAQAETPQGGRHTVMRWTHRTRFQVIRNTPIPDTNLLADAGWEGSIVVEAEGTNEGLADLQLRCGMEWFKPQPGVQPKQGDGGRVFRLMRERSRPGEIWLRTVRMKERIS